MRLKRFLTALTLTVVHLVETAQAQCQCGLFLLAQQEWKPVHLAFTTEQNYPVNCTEASQANESCRRQCEDEVLALDEVFATDPVILKKYHPEGDLPCDVLPAHTSSFYSVCGSQEWQPATSKVSSSVCCHPTSKAPVWCDSLTGNSLESGQETGRAAGERVLERKIDVGNEPNDILNNEIEGSSGTSSDESGQSWMSFILSFFGYNSIGEMIQNIDLLSFPGRIQSAMKTYNDEISMGQCYMEFTTYSVFRQDGVLANLLRNRRDTKSTAEDIIIAESEGKAANPHAYSDPVQSLVGGIIGMLEGSPSTRQYADILRQILPIVMRVYSSDDPASAITSFIGQTIGPMFSQIQTAGPPSPNDIHSDHPSQWPDLRYTTPAPRTTPRPQPQVQSTADSTGSSPIIPLIFQLVQSYLAYPDVSSPPQPNRTTPVPTRAPATKRPPPRPSLASSPSSSNLISSLLGQLFGGGRPQSPSRPKPKPPVKLTPKPQVLEKNDSKDLVEMVLEFIRPVFISIVGKVPGESGVSSIREATRPNDLGRWDDTLIEEVLSPYFCLKNYVVNKAWTLTERGVRSVLARTTPAEKQRMMRMLQEQ
ncbi:uncharacterized protein [Palaemon carinicauda]|uniref:uncharacterized protein n=1 Tax=Palaemon carinicauda TaxID=392227 RepID=UPI0035B5E173